MYQVWLENGKVSTSRFGKKKPDGYDCIEAETLAEMYKMVDLMEHAQLSVKAEAEALKRRVAELEEQLEASQSAAKQWYDWYLQSQNRVAAYARLVIDVIRDIAVDIVSQKTHSQRSQTLRSVIAKMQAFDPNSEYTKCRDIGDIPF